MKDQSAIIRIVTAASLFDGHDAAINIMRRILQSKGAEIIHLGHNRSVQEIVECAIEEDAHAIAVTSYQGGHVEFFKYMKDLLEEAACGHIKIFGGGGGTILPEEIEELHAYGITRIYSPDDGRHLGLEGMIEDVIKQSKPHPPSGGKGIWKDADYYKAAEKWTEGKVLNEAKDIRRIARKITLAELGVSFEDAGLDLMQCSNDDVVDELENRLKTAKEKPAPLPKKEKETRLKNSATGGSWAGAVLGITGTGGAGKSSVTDEIVRRFLHTNTGKTIAVISVDPSRKKTGGALLGDRIRMNAISHPRAYMRSLATRKENTALSKTAKSAIDICRQAEFDLIILESAGVGQSDASIVDFCDVSMYVMTPEYGAASQLEKINMLDYADLICINKFDKAGALDALHDVKKQFKRNHQLWDAKDEDIPVVGTIAAQFNDAGINELFERLIKKIEEKTGAGFEGRKEEKTNKDPMQNKTQIIPAHRIRYLSEITESIHRYDEWVNEQAAIASKMYQLQGAIKTMQDKK